jgi:hypothetical protein
VGAIALDKLNNRRFIVDNLIRLILAHQGKSTDYRIVIKGVHVLPIDVELDIIHLPTSDHTTLVVP